MMFVSRDIIRENQLTTLELIGDAIRDPEKFKKMLKDKQKEI